MILKIQANDLVLRDSSPIYLPDFVVITGENGSGKTQLLTAIRERTSLLGPDELIEDNDSSFTNLVFAGQGFTLVSSDDSEFWVAHNIRNFWESVKPMTLFMDSFVHLPFLDENHHKQIENNAGEIAKMFGQGNPGHSHNYSNLKRPINFLHFVLKKSGKKSTDLTLLDFFTFIPVPISINSQVLRILFHQFLLKKKYFPEMVDGIESPWNLFNMLLDSAGFAYRFVYDPIIKNDFEPKPIFLAHTDTNEIVQIDSLSSGEASFFSLINALYNSNVSRNYPEVLLLDEPDAYLHPSLTNQFLRSVQDVLVKDMGIKVIMTTHSPTTVALTPESSLYVMDRRLGYPLKQDKNDAIRSLTRGLTTFSVELNNRKQIFTEAKDDSDFYQLIFEKILNEYESIENSLVKDQFLQFIPVTGKANGKGGGVDKVIDLTESFRKNGNFSIYGLIDWDCTDRNTINEVVVFGGRTRYNLENFIYDPIFIGAYMLEHSPKPTEFGFRKNEDHASFLRFKSERLQSIIDLVAPQVFRSMDWSEETRAQGVKSDDPVEVTLLCNERVTLPKWYLLANGHSISKACRKAFVAMRNRDTSWWIEEVVKPNYIFLPVEVRNTFASLQQLHLRSDGM